MVKRDRNTNLICLVHVATSIDTFNYTNIFMKKMSSIQNFQKEGKSSEIRKQFLPVMDSEQVDIGNGVCVLWRVLLDTFRTVQAREEVTRNFT